MNLKMVIRTVGRMLVVLALLLLLPMVCSLIYGEFTTALAFLFTAAGSAVIGAVLAFFIKTENTVIYAREGFAITALVWLAMSALGAIPFVLTHSVPTYADAFFETASGLTTTGASIMTDVDSLSHGILFWRSFTHWVGGMGVLVFVMAIVPNLSDRSIHILRAEMPGPVVGKLVPRVRDTAKILYIIYIVMTAVQVIFLWAGGMPFFESLLHSFGTAGTGGFGIKNDSITSYSPYIQWVIAVFMLLFGVNFNLYYMMLLRNFKGALRNTELWFYLAMTAVSTGLIAYNIHASCPSVEASIRTAFFQTSSIITTTGYATTDINGMPILSKGVLFLLMLSGGCAGSTAGGFKVARIVMLVQSAKRDLRRMLHPRSIGVVHMDGKRIDEETLQSLSTYSSLYVGSLLLIFLLLCFEPFDFETNLSAAVSCFNNVGPAFGAAAANYSAYSGPAKLLLSVAMLCGRLEIIPVFFALSPSTWSRK